MQEDKSITQLTIRELATGGHQLHIGNFLITLVSENAEASKPKAALDVLVPQYERISNRKVRCKVKVNGRECGHPLTLRQKGGHNAYHVKAGHIKSKSN